jgi:hypothetical protein
MSAFPLPIAVLHVTVLPLDDSTRFSVGLLNRNSGLPWLLLMRSLPAEVTSPLPAEVLSGKEEKLMTPFGLTVLAPAESCLLK